MRSVRDTSRTPCARMSIASGELVVGTHLQAPGFARQLAPSSGCQVPLHGALLKHFVGNFVTHILKMRIRRAKNSLSTATAGFFWRPAPPRASRSAHRRFCSSCAFFSCTLTALAAVVPPAIRTTCAGRVIWPLVFRPRRQWAQAPGRFQAPLRGRHPAWQRRSIP